MLARVKSSHPQKIIRALCGREYVRYEWRPVPPDREAEASRMAELETRAAADAQPPAESPPAEMASTPILYAAQVDAPPPAAFSPSLPTVPPIPPREKKFRKTKGGSNK